MSESTQGVGGDGYVHEVACHAARDCVFSAVATVVGLRGWWTPIVAGTTRPGGHLAFGFEDMDEAIIMGVDEVTNPTRVQWTCLEHSGAPDWSATTIQFELRDEGPEGCVLTFRHLGVAAEQVAAGWDHFLASLVRLVETGHGHPFRAGETALDVARAYHHAWTAHDFTAARRLLAADLETDVPITPTPVGATSPRRLPASAHSPSTSTCSPSSAPANKPCCSMTCTPARSAASGSPNTSPSALA